MGIYLAEQTLFFLEAILLGFSFGLLYDALRITRVALPTPGWVLFLEDVFFFMVCAVGTFFFLMRAIDGQVRFFILIGEILGLVIYFNSLSILVMGVSQAVIRFIKAVLRFICERILLPIWRLMYNLVVLVMRPVRFLSFQMKKMIQRCKYSLKVRRKVLYNQLRGVIEGKPAKRRAPKAAQKLDKGKRKKKTNVKSKSKRKERA